MTTVKEDLIRTLEELKAELEDLYSKEFLRLTDIEEDYKYDAHDLFMEKITVCLQPLILSGQTPDWMAQLRVYLSTKAAQPRTCFQLIDGSLAILK